MSKKNKMLIFSLIMLVVSIIYTVLVKTVDIANIGPNNSEVGFSTLNGTVHNLIGVNMIWYDITKYLGILPFLLVAYYGFIGLKQLITEKSLLKIDKKIIALGIFYVIFACIYVFFEIVIINFRPTLIDGELEASYPSTHTLLAICICGSSLLVSKCFINNEKLRKIIDLCTVIVMISIVIGRIISGVHWASDIIGGIIISTFLLSSFYTAILMLKGNK